MKVQVTLKDPDGVYDSITHAISAWIPPEGLDADEIEAAKEVREEKVREALGRWIKYGEYLTVDFDTDAMTATVRVAK